MKKHLYCVKSVMTILLTVTVVILSFIYPDKYEDTIKNCATMVVTFYFAHQEEKRLYYEQNNTTL